MPAIERFEFTPVHTTPHASVDIIFLHGLQGSPSKTWRANATNDEGTAGGIFWPRDLLPATLAGAPANVIMYGYNADVASTSGNPGGPSQNYMFNHAQNLVALLTLYRKRSGHGAGDESCSFNGGKHRPILWVAHSLGGILLKAALNYSEGITDFNLEDQRGVYVSTYGIIFLGTPHVGSDLAEWGHLVQRTIDAVFPWKLVNTEAVLLKTLKRESETLVNINQQFLQIQHRFKIHLAYETQKSVLKGVKAMVVEQPGAANPLPGAICYGIEATHSGMCRFDRPTAPGYVAVSTQLREWVYASHPFVQLRWEAECEERWRYLFLQASERLWESRLLSCNDQRDESVSSQRSPSPSAHAEIRRNSMASDIGLRPPSRDQATHASPSSTDCASSSSTVVEPTSTPSSPRSCISSMAAKPNRLCRSNAGHPPSALHHEWTRFDSHVDPQPNEDSMGPNTAGLLRPPEVAFATGSSGVRSCDSSPGVQQCPFQPSSQLHFPESLHRIHWRPQSAPAQEE